MAAQTFSFQPDGFGVLTAPLIVLMTILALLGVVANVAAM
jgi:hypothetical protein